MRISRWLVAQLLDLHDQLNTCTLFISRQNRAGQSLEVVEESHKDKDVLRKDSSKDCSCESKSI